MSERTQHWPPSEQVPVGYNRTNEGLKVQGSWVQGYYSTYSTTSSSESQEQPVSPQEIPLYPYPGYTSHSITPVHPPIRDGAYSYLIEEQDTQHGRLASQELADINIPDQFHLLLGRNELSSSGDGQVLWPFLIPSRGAVGPPMPTTTTDLSAHSPVATSTTGPCVIEPVAAENNLRAVGSLQIQQAACKRRKKDKFYQCPFRNAGCTSTFTALHNLRYHLNAHRGLKPYKCRKCSFAADSPTSVKRHTLKRHASSCNGLDHKRDV